MMGREESDRIGKGYPPDTRPAYRGGGIGFPNLIPKGRMHRISAFAPGQSSINRVYIKSGGNEVTQLKAGDKFKVYVDFDAQNLEGGTWSTCLTVVDLETGQIRNWHKSNASSNGQVVDEMGENVMPDHNVTLRVKLWGHDDVNPSPPYPSMEMW